MRDSFRAKTSHDRGSFDSIIRSMPGIVASATNANLS